MNPPKNLLTTCDAILARPTLDILPIDIDADPRQGEIEFLSDAMMTLRAEGRRIAAAHLADRIRATYFPETI